MMHLKDTRVKYRKLKIILLLSLILLTGFISTSLISYHVAHDALSRQIRETALPLTSDNIYSEIQRDLLQPIFISSLMAQDTFLRDWVLDGEEDASAMIRYLGEIQKQYNTITSFFVSENTRRYYHPSGVIKRVSGSDPQDAWYFRVRRMRTDYEINVDTDTADQRSMVIFINYRVYDYSGKYIGATGVGLAVNAVKEMIDSYQNRYGREVFFTDMEGRITLHSERYQGADHIRGIPGLDAFATQILTSPGSSLSYESQGNTTFVNSRLVPQFRWYLMVMQSQDPSRQGIHHILMFNLGISLVITLIALLLVYLVISGYQKKLETMATTDKLTGAANRQAFDMLFEQALKGVRRNKTPLSAVMFDIDHFKEVNDTFGHTTGDTCLKCVAGIARSRIREMDILFRWGGEEFLILLADCSLDQAAKIADDIRVSLTRCKEVAHHGRNVTVSASFGVAQLADSDVSTDLIRRADQALYSAKERGRNRVETETSCAA